MPASPAVVGASTGNVGSVDDLAPKTSWTDRGLDLGIYVALAALVVYFAVASQYFLTQANLLNIGQAVAITGILAAGLTMALVAGQLDLTIGATLALSSVVSAMALQNWGWDVPAAVVVGLLVGLGVGLVNGWLVVSVGINSIIATIAMSIAIRGLALEVTSGQNTQLTSTTLPDFVNSRPLGVPVPLLIMAVIYLIGYVVLTHTVFGYHVYATGGNVSAAQRSGIKVRSLYRYVFLVTGLLAGLTGVITTGRAGAGGADYGLNTEFDVLAAVLLGGIGLGGGAGRIQRTLAGVVLIGVLDNGLTLLNVSSYAQQLVQGLVFVLAVVMGAVREKRQRR